MITFVNHFAYLGRDKLKWLKKEPIFILSWLSHKQIFPPCESDESNLDPAPLDVFSYLAPSVVLWTEADFFKLPCSSHLFPWNIFLCPLPFVVKLLLPCMSKNFKNVIVLQTKHVVRLRHGALCTLGPCLGTQSRSGERETQAGCQWGAPATLLVIIFIALRFSWLLLWHFHANYPGQLN